ncbi:hypothetical protein NCCP2716_28170 [Sporosarcina sp. NCCP-2716]|uniref:DUF1097 domain-containing protein n=1 Tax=Sporosarcina sp. NCCP-2716 TaxID=2943679 RepID=UPI00203E62D0|nr:DUF1097 domain-containing protein [Sporosarcina sp. NCCP-2716]GKV70319.1 hypothetical protein NCCP2716_28170 [Sporosarcina sp. NCCP-2716]
MRDRIPLEVVSSVLAATSVLLALPPLNLPPWALFIGWAGTMASGGPKKEVMTKIWKTMPIGSFTALLIVLVKDDWLGPMLPGHWPIAGEMATIFVFNCGMMLLGRTKWSLFVPGMFLGFASFFATYYGGWGPVTHNVWAAFIAVVIMNALGPVYAWLNAKLAFPVAEQQER